MSALLLALPVLVACTGGEGPASAPCLAEQWGPDTSGYYAYAHDCDPYASAHFTVYSDGSSRAAKQTLAEITEAIFVDLGEAFHIEDVEEELRFGPGYTYYIYAEKHLETIRAMGFRNGFFVQAIDCVTHPSMHARDPAFFRYTIQHELSHVFQFTLTDCPSNDACPEWLGVWFREGQAILMGDPPRALIVDSLAGYLAWTADPDHVNPIRIHRWTDFPDPASAGQYYPLFGLAYWYLVDPEGHGATVSDMRDLFRYMAEGDSFEGAFPRALGLSVSSYAERFDSLMRSYLAARDAGNQAP